MVAFLVTQSRGENALMPLSLFKNQRFLSVNILYVSTLSSVGRDFYMVPFFAIQIKHLDAVATGAAFLPAIAVMFIFASRIGRMSAPLRRAAIPDHWGCCFGSGDRAFRYLC